LMEGPRAQQQGVAQGARAVKAALDLTEVHRESLKSLDASRPRRRSGFGVRLVCSVIHRHGETASARGTLRRPADEATSGGRPGRGPIRLRQLGEASKRLWHRAEAAGKTVIPLIIPTNDALYAIVRTARDLRANQVAVGLSNLTVAEDQINALVSRWRDVNPDRPGKAPLSIRVLSKSHDIHYDVDGGNRIPTFAERRAQSVAELRWAGVGIHKVLLLHDGSPYGSDLFQGVLTMLDPVIEFTVLRAPAGRRTVVDVDERLRRDALLAGHLKRTIRIDFTTGDAVTIARQDSYGLIVVPLANSRSEPLEDWVEHILAHAHCPVALMAPPVIPRETAEPHDPRGSGAAELGSR